MVSGNLSIACTSMLALPPHSLYSNAHNRRTQWALGKHWWSEHMGGQASPRITRH